MAAKKHLWRMIDTSSDVECGETSTDTANGKDGDGQARVGDFMSEPELVCCGQEGLLMEAQVSRMSTDQILRDPVRAAIYRRGWADRSVDMLQSSLKMLPVSSGPVQVSCSPAVKVRTEAQKARIRRNFQKLKEKIKAREQLISRLTTQPAPISDPEAANRPPSEPTPAVVTEDLSAKNGEMSDEPVPATSQVQPSEAANPASSNTRHFDWSVEVDKYLSGQTT